MALDVRRVAVLAANILYLHRRAEDERLPRPAFWTSESLGKAGCGSYIPQIDRHTLAVV